MATLAYSYVRMSTERQQKGDSLRRQLDWSAAFAERHALVLDNSLRDIGVSAWRGKNRKKGALGEFLRRVEEGEVPRGSYLLVESLDRLSRDQVMEALDLFRSILRQGITIATMDPEQVYTLDSVNRDFGQLIIALTFMSRANEESERKSSRVRQAMQNKRDMAANGHKTTSRTPSWITPTKLGVNNYSYAINHLGPIIQEIFAMSADGMGKNTIARMLNQRGVPTATNSKQGWYDNTIARIITSRAAIGEHQPVTVVNERVVPAGDPIPGYYPAVVSVDVWQRAQKPVVKREKGVKGEGLHNMLGDLCRCAHCGARMFMKGSGYADGMFPYTYYLQCRAGRQGALCKKGKSAFRYRAVEDSILDNIKEFAFADVLRLRQQNDEVQGARERLAEAIERLALVQKQTESVVDALMNRGSSDALLTRLDALEQQVATAKSDVAECDRQFVALQAQARANDPTDLIQQLREEWLTTEDLDRRYALRSRCQQALRQYVQQIDFDSAADVYRVVIKGSDQHPNIRAYEFENKKRWSRSHVPAMRMVDVMPFMPTDPAYGDADALAERGMTAIESGLANIRDDAGEFQPTNS